MRRGLTLFGGGERRICLGIGYDESVDLVKEFEGVFFVGGGEEWVGLHLGDYRPGDARF